MEAELLTNKFVLFHEGEIITKNNEHMITYLNENFCGKVISDIDVFNNMKYTGIVYIYGDIKAIFKKMKCDWYNVNIIYELSINEMDGHIVTLGEVPININNVGVYFRNFFNNEKDYHKLIMKEHKFQKLTESNKKNKALRSGIYLTKVEKQDKDIKFKLLRCSTNFTGPTDNFRESDKEIIENVNKMRKLFYKDSYELNHVLAQTYHNTISDDKERKAVIKRHSDKTKDMPKNGLIAFCTFYENYTKDGFNHLTCVNKSKKDSYDYVYKGNTSVLTKLRFVLKSTVKDEKYVKKFDVTLYPHSVFIIPLSTNRLYTHEIIPSNLPIQYIPTRMGYVIRCSNTNALFKNNKTYIDDNGLIELTEPTKDGIERLKALYRDENITTKLVEYKGFNFSLNEGDYIEPYV